MRAIESPAGRLYLPASSGTDAAQDARRVAAALPNARPCRLQILLEIRGASAGAPAAFHYVVETEVLPECEDDFNAWYDEEHLAGLAAVPGTIRAVRYLRLDGSPKYGAFYELVSREVLGSPAWLEVRATAWSSRVRPAFRNTTRVMYAMV